MVKIFNLYLFLIGLTYSVSAQTISGCVTDRETKHPISYVSVGLLNKNGGTYGDSDGKFVLQIRNIETTDSVRFSCVGYTPATFLVSELLGRDYVRIYLEKQLTTLREVVVYPRNNETLILGNKHSNQHICICAYDEYESGIVIENNKKIFLDKLTFGLSSKCTPPPDSVLIRVNFYNVSNGIPDELIISEPIYFMLLKELKHESVTLDISKYGIHIESDFAATIEIIKKYGSGSVCFAGWISGNPTIKKFGKQGKWGFPVDDKRKKIKIYQSLVISASSEK